jgi:hypothetical protein
MSKEINCQELRWFQENYGYGKPHECENCEKELDLLKECYGY